MTGRLIVIFAAIGLLAGCGKAPDRAEDDASRNVRYDPADPGPHRPLSALDSRSGPTPPHALIGTWRRLATFEEHDFNATFTTTYAEDGTLKFAMEFEEVGNFRPQDLTGTGKWEISGKTLRSEVIESSNQVDLPSGTVVEVTLLRIDDTTLRYRAKGEPPIEEERVLE